MLDNNILLSVIVPGYNTEEYIRECLDSVVAQDMDNIEVLMVDDESPDSTGEIMDEFAEKYDNFHVFHIKNVGLSGVRNLGISKAKGRYLAFLDSDDIVPLGAYKKMVDSGLSNDADIITGAVNRFNSQKNVRSVLHKKGIKNAMVGTSIHEHPELVYDTTSHNSIYKREFILEQGILFPEGVLYEDIPFKMAVFLNANHVNILEDLTYYWRWREGETKSITQDRLNLKMIQQRIDAINNTRKMVVESGNETLLQMFDLKALEFDLPLFFPPYTFNDQEFISEFHKKIYHYLTTSDNQQLSKVSPKKQARYLAILNNDLEVINDYTHNRVNDAKIVLDNNQLTFTDPRLEKYEWLKDIQVEESLLMTTKVLKVFKAKNGDIRINAVVYQNMTQYLKRNDNNEKISAELYNVDTNETYPLEVSRYKSAMVKNTFRQKMNVGLRISIDFETIVSKLTPGDWQIRIKNQFYNTTSETLLGNPHKGQKKFAMHAVDDYMLSNHYNFNWEYVIHVEDKGFEVSSLAYQSGVLEIGGLWNHPVNVPVEYWLVNQGEELYQGFYDEDSQTVRFELADEVIDGKATFKIYGPNRKNLPYLIANQDICKTDLRGETLEYTAQIPNATTLKFFSGEKTIFIKEVKKQAEGRYVLRFSDKYLSDIPQDLAVTLRWLSADNKNVYEFPVELVDGQWQTIVSVINDEGLYLMANKYYASLIYSQSGENHEHYVRILPELTAELTAVDSETHKLKFSSTPTMRFALDVTQKWGKTDRTKRKRGINYSILYPLMRWLPLKKKTVVYDSYWAKSFNCSPKAIYDYLVENHPEYEHVWVFTDTNTPIEGPGKKIRKNSFDYWYYLARAKFFVENTNMPDAYSKRTNQVEIQTFHGTFMKTMGFDEPFFKNSPNLGRLNRFARRIDNWDYAVSPSPYMTQKIKQAFGFERTVIESGFPRNDSLYDVSPDKIENIKVKLNLPRDKKMILYAPTYREKQGLEIALDIEMMAERLSDEYVLLTRFHYFVANKADLPSIPGFLYNVSSYPSIEELYSIADVLITDYSSVMFDYAHLKRPMMFYAYDLEEYTEDKRGVYLDYEKVAPGPIVKEMDQLIAELTDYQGLVTNYETKRQQFYDEFCTFGQDGQAAKQVVEQAILSATPKRKGEKLLTNKVQRVLKTDKLFVKMFEHYGNKPKKNLIVFESFFGTQYSDSPKAIYEYLKDNNPEGYQLMWSITKEMEPYFKEHNIPYFIRLTLKAAKIMPRAKFWIVNSRLPLVRIKRVPKGTTVLNSWHGTPLKTIGLDVELVTMPGKTTEQYHKDIANDSVRWDYTVGPNRYTSDILQRAFLLEPEQVINSGYPRNDTLINDNNPAYISQIKKKLNIPTDKKVILYAPTWRDNDFVGGSEYRASLELDIARLKEVYGDSAVLVMRLHYMIAKGVDLSPYGDFVRDASQGWDITDLYLASDVLITDYSSVFFDYSILRRPMIFFAYDIEEYANDIRGFYFDYQEEAPGAIVKTNDELIVALDDAFNNQGELSPRYVAFIEKFAAWEDGKASERVVNFLLYNQRHTVKTVEIEPIDMLLDKSVIVRNNVYGAVDSKVIATRLVETPEPITLLSQAYLEDPIQHDQVGKLYYQVAFSDGSCGWVCETELFEPEVSEEIEVFESTKDILEDVE
ncbi:bifunctional glycosyltransferase/CDP-glycerol:glycerophosphate glycerophosphotransferase [Vagococcus zengguangii]|uniref:bifunctional glycosyltransferase/CDP-glycerol:glycerophosphate glycerophosphotransferase n=1 Tax=Vagococcus zengguangii TaxID=2571750 RepID=UPI0011088FCA|nr:bifunctional glycosyltransferase/CDP-glycerol:glycerophosphate glycerophosphotransferase [Vagococcus zengguangii]TLG80918.1 glycosyltransferase [Vagococcus zengguangii]